MTEQSPQQDRHKAFDHASGSQRQYDYFVTAGAGAALAWSLQQFPARPTVIAIDFLAPIGWGLLLASLTAGVFRLSTQAWSASVSYRTHIVADKIQQRSDAILTGGVKPLTGELLAPAEVAAELRQLQTDMKGLHHQRDKLLSRGTWAKRIQTVSLLSGFGTLALWRTLALFLS